MTYEEALAWLDSLQGSGIRPGLGRVKALLRAAENPHHDFPSVIVAGTNGKGSTAATLASILSDSGYREGLYTSPHLVDVRERWRVAGKNVSGTALAEATEHLQKASQVSGILPTYFEALTVAAFILFRASGCDVVVLEVGMGGRLDATNVVNPLASVITSISFDHVEFLGKTIRAIAREKAGVIHRGARVVTSNCDPVVLDVLRKRAGEFGEVLHTLDAETTATDIDAGADGIRFSLRTPQSSYQLRSSLTGAHQVMNVSLAVRCAELIAPALPLITSRSIERGVETTLWRGRLERFLIDTKVVYVDGAHNPEGAETLASFVAGHLPPGRSLVFGALADKDFSKMAGALFPLFETIVLTEPDSDRALPVEQLAPIARATRARVVIQKSPSDAVRAALGATGEAVVVCGSLYLAGSAIELLDRMLTATQSRSSSAESTAHTAPS